MRGQILGVDTRTGEGLVAGDDGQRYRFTPDDWAHRGEPAIGLHVDFEADDTRARSLFPVPIAPNAMTLQSAMGPVAAPARAATRSDRNKVVAALLAFFVGVLGLHRFYLGRTGSAIVMLVLSMTMAGLAVTVPWALIDTIRYLTMSDEEFEARYSR